MKRVLALWTVPRAIVTLIRVSLALRRRPYSAVRDELARAVEVSSPGPTDRFTEARRVGQLVNGVANPIVKAATNPNPTMRFLDCISMTTP